MVPFTPGMQLEVRWPSGLGIVSHVPGRLRCKLVTSHAQRPGLARDFHAQGMFGRPCAWSRLVLINSLCQLLPQKKSH